MFVETKTKIQTNKKKHLWSRYNIWFKASQRWKRRFLALRYVTQHLAFSPTIPVACKRCIRRSITECCTAICPATLLLLKHACDIPTACHLSVCQFSPNHNLAMKTLYEKLYVNLQTHFTSVHIIFCVWQTGQ